jgi:hypothetical protein
VWVVYGLRLPELLCLNGERYGLVLYVEGQLVEGDWR